MTLNNASIGTLLLGVLLNTILYSVVVYQYAVYYQTKSNEWPAIKYIVFLLFVWDTFHSTSVTYMAWKYIVAIRSDPTALAVIRWPYALSPIDTALAALVTQIFQGCRIWRLSKNRITYIVIVLLAISSFILGLVCTIEIQIINVFSDLSRIIAFVFVWLSMQVVTDTFIAINLIFALLYSRTGIPRLDAVLYRIVRCVIQTGLLADVFCIADLIMFAAFPGTNFYGVFGIPLGRIYTNTLLYTLLIRKSLREEMADGHKSDSPGAIEMNMPPTPDRPVDEHAAQEGA